MKNIKTFEDLVFYDWYMKGAFQMLLALQNEMFPINEEPSTLLDQKKLLDYLLGANRETRYKFMVHDYDFVGLRNHKYKILKNGKKKLIDYDCFLARWKETSVEA